MDAEPAGRRPAVVLLHNGIVVTVDPDLRVFREGGLVVEADKIKAIGQSPQILRDFSSMADEIVDLNGRILLPGFINTHVHTSQQLARGIADDVDLLTWLHGRIWPFESNMTEEDSFISTLLCGIELIRSGVTCFAEAGGQHVSGMARAVELLGIRACLTQSTMDSGVGLPEKWAAYTTDHCIQSQKELYRKHHNTADGRIRVWFGLRQIMNATDRLLLETRDAAKELETGIHMHVAEIQFENKVVMVTRQIDHGTVTYLEKIGLLQENLLAAHSVWVNESEVGFLLKGGVKISHCPAAAMRMLGFAPIKEMIDAGICVSLGTDGAPSNNRMSIVDEMYLASLINKGREAHKKGETDPTALPAETVLKMVTADGAKSVLWDSEIGTLEIGKKQQKCKKENQTHYVNSECRWHQEESFSQAIFYTLWMGSRFGLLFSSIIIGVLTTSHIYGLPSDIRITMGHFLELMMNILRSFLLLCLPVNVCMLKIWLYIDKQADLIVVDPFTCAMMPLHDCISSLVYCMRTENIYSVMCNGQWIMKDRKILSINEEEVLSLAKRASVDIMKRAGIKIPQKMNFL